MVNYREDFRNPHFFEEVVAQIKKYRGRPLVFMEVCGTHTMSIFQNGIRDLLPPDIELVSGPGCPVCVTPVGFVDAAVDLAEKPEVVLTTFGDMLRIPGSRSSLALEKAAGAEIQVVYSPLDAVLLAESKPDRQVVFLSVGFETTTPVTALALRQAAEKQLSNFFVLTANKTMPAAMEMLARQGRIDGFLLPGHVCAISGLAEYEAMALEYGIPGVAAGFEPLDLLQALLLLSRLAETREGRVVNQYARVVRPEGNKKAKEIVKQVFEPCNAQWRGLGCIEGSGLCLRKEYEAFDAWKHFKLEPVQGMEPEGCRCGQVLMGNLKPDACPLFGKACTPAKPVGACMVSSEGTCAAYYRYGGAE